MPLLIKYLFSIVLLVIINSFGPVSTNNVVLAQESSSSGVTREEFILMEQEFRELRSENYQNAIKSAEEVGSKADRILNWLVGIATVFSIGIAFFAFIVGGDIWRLRNLISRHEKNIKSKEKAVEEIEKNGTTLLENLQKISKKIEISEKSGNKNHKDLQKMLTEANGIMNSLRSLKTSANYVSNVSQYPTTISAASEIPVIGTYQGNSNLVEAKTESWTNDWKQFGDRLREMLKEDSK